MCAEVVIVFGDDRLEHGNAFDGVPARRLRLRLEAVEQREPEHRLRLEVVGERSASARMPAM